MNAGMQTAIAEAVAKALAAKGASNGRRKSKKKGAVRAKSTDEQKAVRAAANAVEAVKLFTDAGYDNCVANVTILTYGKWAEQGRIVKKGEKALRLNGGAGYPLFHLDQTEPVAEVAAA